LSKTEIQRIQIAPEFKKQTTKAILAVVLFIFSYLLMVVLTIGLTIICIIAGLGIIISIVNFFTLIFGVGLMSLGVLILVFLFKFMFKSVKRDTSNFREITRSEEPQLFALIDDVVKSVGTHFPKKVYLTPDVNAGVFFNILFLEHVLTCQEKPDDWSGAHQCFHDTGM
jgi:hypothetical protein